MTFSSLRNLRDGRDFNGKFDLNVLLKLPSKEASRVVNIFSELFCVLQNKNKNVSKVLEPFFSFNPSRFGLFSSFAEGKKCNKLSKPILIQFEIFSRAFPCQNLFSIFIY